VIPADQKALVALVEDAKELRLSVKEPVSLQY